MSVMLRILLIVFSVITSIVVIHKIRKAKLRIDDAVFWVCFSDLPSLPKLSRRQTFYT